MTELDLEKLIATTATNKTVGQNANSIMGALKEGNATLAEFQKTVSILKSMGVFPVLVRAVGKKYDIDVETPLKSDAGIQPNTAKQKEVMTAFSKLSDEQIDGVLIALKNQQQKKLSAGTKK